MNSLSEIKVAVVPAGLSEPPKPLKIDFALPLMAKRRYSYLPNTWFLVITPIWDVMEVGLIRPGISSKTTES